MTEITEKNEKMQEQLTMTEYKLLDNCLRFRGVPESHQEVRQEMVDILAEFLEKPQDEVE